MKLSFQLYFLFSGISIISIAVNASSCSTGGTGKENAASVSGTVVRIIDGDTYDLLLDGQRTTRVRMEGIDAPERGMPYYRVSKKYLGNLCFEKHVTLKISGTDNHGRLLGFTFLDDGTELSHEMIKAGMAWHFKKYNFDKSLAALENQARANARGLWKDKNPMPPWTNRKLHRMGVSTKDSFNAR